jgi:hypothetical protein
LPVPILFRYPRPVDQPPPPTADEVARGVARYFHALGWASQRESPLPNGRRADVQAIGPCGRIAIVEIKVSLADLRGDAKWPEYLPWCDRFYWAVPPGFPLAPFADAARGPGRAGLIIADRFEGALLTDPAEVSLAPARRKAETLRFARRAALRLMTLADPVLAERAAIEIRSS